MAGCGRDRDRDVQTMADDRDMARLKQGFPLIVGGMLLRLQWTEIACNTTKAMSGTELAYAATKRSAMSGTELAYDATKRDAISSTELAYAGHDHEPFVERVEDTLIVKTAVGGGVWLRYRAPRTNSLYCDTNLCTELVETCTEALVLLGKRVLRRAGWV
eukprot:3940290-Rhodomonas_salina.4